MYKFILLFVLFLWNCTGINLRTYPFPFSPNTHPVQEYGHLTVLGKGGAVYHKNYSIESVGTYPVKRQGRACNHSLFYLVAFGDSSIESARIEGAVSRVAFIGHEVLSLFGIIYHRHCTVVTGE